MAGGRWRRGVAAGLAPQDGGAHGVQRFGQALHRRDAMGDQPVAVGGVDVFGQGRADRRWNAPGFGGGDEDRSIGTVKTPELVQTRRRIILYQNRHICRQPADCGGKTGPVRVWAPRMCVVWSKGFDTVAIGGSRADRSVLAATSKREKARPMVSAWSPRRPNR